MWEVGGIKIERNEPVEFLRLTNIASLILTAGGCGMSSVSGRVTSCIHSGPLKIILQVPDSAEFCNKFETDLFLQLASYGAVCYA